MSSKNINKLILDSADAVSHCEESAEQYLIEEGIDFEAYLSKGMSDLNIKPTAKAKKELDKSQSYFRRAVLAAKIVHECYQEWTFGVVKFQKLVYLSEQVSSMNFASDYRKQAAGPMDHKFIHSIKGEFEKQKWFSVKQEGQYKKWVFTPGNNLEGYKNYYQSYFSNESEDIQFLIDSFRKWKTVDVELIATLYACWKEAKVENALINDDLLKQKVYKWHTAKGKFKEDDIISKIRWMEENGVYPN
jgi:hypothetical protein